MYIRFFLYISFFVVFYTINASSYAKYYQELNIIDIVSSIYKEYEYDNYDKIKKRVSGNSYINVVDIDENLSIRDSHLIKMVADNFPIFSYQGGVKNSINIVIGKQANNYIRENSEKFPYFKSERITNSECYYLFDSYKDEVNLEDFFVSYIIVDAELNQQMRSYCIYKSITIIFGFDRYLFEYLSKEQREYMKLLEVDPFLFSILYDAEMVSRALMAEKMGLEE